MLYYCDTDLGYRSYGPEDDAAAREGLHGIGRAAVVEHRSLWEQADAWARTQNMFGMRSYNPIQLHCWVKGSGNDGTLLTNGPELVIADSVVVAGKSRQQLRNGSRLRQRSCARARHVLPTNEKILGVSPAMHHYTALTHPGHAHIPPFCRVAATTCPT